jgi:phosphatidylserine decarboxylase
MPVAREGYPYILVFVVSGVIMLSVGWLWPGLAVLLLALFVLYFFRDPERAIPTDPGQILSPADGRVVSVRSEEGAEVISIFLSVFNVHINRAPMGGTISKIEYSRGKFLAAFDARASSENERNSITIDNGGRSVRFVQIAGILARRIVCWCKEGEALAAGERVGLIKFGSRVDVFFPPGARVTVEKGRRVKGGESVIGVWNR